MKTNAKKQTFMPESFYNFNNDITLLEVRKLYKHKQIVTGIAETWDNKNHQFKVNLGNGILAILPESEITTTELKFNEQEIPVQARIILKKKICFYIGNIDGDTILLSRKKLQEDVIKSLSKNVTYMVEVVNFYKSGIFIDVGCGVTGFIHFTEIAVNKYLNFRYNNIKVGAIITACLLYDDSLHFSYRRTVEYNIKNIGDTVQGIVLARVPEGNGYFIFVSPNEAGIVDTNDILLFDFKDNFKVKDVDVKTEDDGDVKVYYKLLPLYEQ